MLRHVRIVLLAVLGVLLAIPALADNTLKWLFGPDYPAEFDSSKIEMTDSGLRLKTLDQTDGDASDTGFGGATLNNTLWNSAVKGIILDNKTNVWGLPDQGSANGWTNMTGNKLLLHFEPGTGEQGQKSELADSSGNDVQVTCTSCPTVTKEGKVGSGLQFNGINQSLSVAGTWGGAEWTDVTIEAWVKVDGPTGDLQAIASSSGLNFFHFQSYDKAASTTVNAVYTDKGMRGLIVQPLYPYGEWRHVAITVKAGSPGVIVLYENGMPVRVDNKFVFAYITQAQELLIGAGYQKKRFFKGTMDEVAIYQRVLSAKEIMDHYVKGAALVGHVDSRVIEVGAAAQWQALSWSKASPFGPLPDNGGSENTYQFGNVKMNGNALLLHLDEDSGSTFADTSGKNNSATCSGGGCPDISSGLFAKARKFDGVNDQIVVASNPGLDVTTAVTMEAWIYQTTPSHASQGFGIASKGNCNGNDAVYELLTAARDTGLTEGIFRLCGKGYISTGSVPLNEWAHLVGTYDGIRMSLYINGSVVGILTASGPIKTDANPLAIGVRQVHMLSEGNSHFAGFMDEVAIYGRALSPEEVRDRYRRGALRLKFQVRSCDDSKCEGEQFVGPGGMANTFYEGNAAGTTQSATLTNIQPNPYFQYRAILESRDPFASPVLGSVAITPTHFPAYSPPATVTTELNVGKLIGFADMMGEGNKGKARYQLSVDGKNWYYIPYTKWKLASGYLQTNSALKIGEYAKYFSEVASSGPLFVRAFLNSPTGAEQMELKGLEITYTDIVPPLPPPPPETPKIKDNPSLTVQEGSILQFKLGTADPTFTPPLAFSCKSNCPEGLSVDGAGGNVSWTPTYKQASNYPDITLKIADAAGKEELQAVDIVVEDTDSAPQLADVGDMFAIMVGQSVTTTVSAKDPDGDAVAYQITSGSQQGMTLDASSGAFSWTPSADQAGIYTVTLRAVDDNQPQLFSERTMTIFVNKSAPAETVPGEPVGVAPTGPVAPEAPIGGTEGAKADQKADTVVSGCTLIP